jgi:alanyl-tRNA synthetase
VTGPEIRQRFPQHVERREHLILDSAPLVPVEDPKTPFELPGDFTPTGDNR